MAGGNSIQVHLPLANEPVFSVVFLRVMVSAATVSAAMDKERAVAGHVEQGPSVTLSSESATRSPDQAEPDIPGVVEMASQSAAFLRNEIGEAAFQGPVFVEWQSPVRPQQSAALSGEARKETARGAPAVVRSESVEERIQVGPLPRLLFGPSLAISRGGGIDGLLLAVGGEPEPQFMVIWEYPAQFSSNLDEIGLQIPAFVEVVHDGTPLKSPINSAEKSPGEKDLSPFVVRELRTAEVALDRPYPDLTGDCVTEEKREMASPVQSLMEAETAG